MSIRKFLNIQLKPEKEKIKADIENITANCGEIATKERDDMRQNQEMRDGTCPNCRTKKKSSPDAIVDKIRNVQGKGSVGGNFLGVSGSMLINTTAINHCNKCGHEWEKFKIKSISSTDILRVCLNYLGEIIKDPTQKTREWKVEAVKKAFDGSYAESIFRCYQKEYDFLHTKANLFQLRKHYQSVFDPENNKKLEKI